MGLNQPNLFLLGAPKCGTTAIYTYLGTHPHVYFPAEKEPHFYAEDFPSHRSCTTSVDYNRLYAGVHPTHQIIGDASILTLYSRCALPRILADSPQARFLIAVRNPADLVVSLHRQFVWSGRERDSNFVTAWQREVALVHRSTAGSSKGSPDAASSLLHYPDYGRLGTRLEHLLSVVDRSRVHVLFLEDIQMRPREVYLQLLDFLELTDDGRREFPRINEGRQHRWLWLSRIFQSRPWLMKSIKQLGLSESLLAWGTRPASRTTIPVKFQNEVRKYFENEIVLLAELTQRGLSHWLSSDSELRSDTADAVC